MIKYLVIMLVIITFLLGGLWMIDHEQENVYKILDKIREWMRLK